MSLVINTNVSALNTQRALQSQDVGLAQTLARLSSGLRINSAKDDAAGLAISERFTTQIRGLSQAGRNMNDAISLSQTAEGALGSLTELMQRGRELAVQAVNATNSTSDRQAIQKEIDQISEEIDRVIRDTSFNNVKLFQPSGATGGTTSTLSATEQRIVDDLQSGWLAQAETLIKDYYGLEASGVTLNIDLQATTATGTAAVSFFDAPTNSMTLIIDVGEFETLYAALDGGNTTIADSLDQLIAHEMTHAVMAATTNLETFPLWFTEGTAEFIPGGDTRVANVLTGLGGNNATNRQAIVDGIDTMDGVADPAWTASQQEYATAYVATRYLDSIAPGGVPAALDYLSQDGSRTLDDYFAQAGIAGISSQADFATNFKANGEAFLAGFNLANDDTGAIGGADASGGTRNTTFAGVIPDGGTLTDDPLSGFIEVWPGTETTLATATMTFQVGANVGETIDVSLTSLSLEGLQLEALDVVTFGNTAINAFDSALDQVNSMRSQWGAVQNRLESAIAVSSVGVENLSASRSRIQDADFAQETANLTRSQILQQASTTMLAQANAIPQQVLSLLS